MNDKQTVEEVFYDHPEPDGYWYPNRAVVELQRKAYKVGQYSEQEWIDTEVDKAVQEELTNAIVNIVKKFYSGDIMVRDIERLENCLPNPPTPTNKDTQNS